jgi:hypothetical protein
MQRSEKSIRWVLLRIAAQHLSDIVHIADAEVRAVEHVSNGMLKRQKLK